MDLMNVCERCLMAQGKQAPDSLVFETGTCDHCGQVADVIDPALLSLYEGLGFSAGDIYRKLPRLRRYQRTELTWRDIGREVAAHLRGST